MGEYYKKFIKVTLGILSVLFVLISSLEKIALYVSNIIVGVIDKNPGVKDTLIESYKTSYKAFLPNYIIDYLFLVITLIAIPLCLKYKKSIVSKITIIIIPLICLVDIANYFITGSFITYGFVSIFIMVYSVVVSVFVFKDIEL